MNSTPSPHAANGLRRSQWKFATAACGAALLGLAAAAMSDTAGDETYYPPEEAVGQVDTTPPTGAAEGLGSSSLAYAGHLPVSGWAPAPQGPEYGPDPDIVISPPANGMPDSTESDRHDHEAHFSGGYSSGGQGYAPVLAQPRAGE